MTLIEILRALHRKFFGANLHAVDPGKVYRVARGRLATPDFKALLEELGIKTAVDLRREKTSSEDDLEPEDFDALGVRFENVHVRSSALPVPSKLSRFMDILSEAEYPVLLYCKRGTDKSGFASMLYLMLEKGRPFEVARDQLAFIPFGHRKRRHDGPWVFMRLLKENGPVSDLKAWIREEYPALFRRECPGETDAESVSP